MYDCIFCRVSKTTPAVGPAGWVWGRQGEGGGVDISRSVHLVQTA